MVGTLALIEVCVSFPHFTHEQNVSSSKRIVTGIGQLTLMPPSRVTKKETLILKRICVPRFQVICISYFRTWVVFIPTDRIASFLVLILEELKPS